MLGMVGDDLTIVLFFIGLAVTFLVAGMSQAEWKHWALITALFIAAGLFLAVGGAWPWIKDLSPSSREIVTRIATNPVAWFAVIILGMTGAIFIGRKHISEREEPKSIIPGAKTEQPGPQNINPLESYFSKKVIRIVDLVQGTGTGYIIKDKVFEDCVFYGPGVIGFRNNGAAEYCSFEGNPESTPIVVENNRTVVGVIGFDNCTLRRCRFVGLGIVGTREFFFMKGIVGKPCPAGSDRP